MAKCAGTQKTPKGKDEYILREINDLQDYLTKNILIRQDIENVKIRLAVIYDMLGYRYCPNEARYVKK